MEVWDGKEKWMPLALRDSMRKRKMGKKKTLKGGKKTKARSALLGKDQGGSQGKRGEGIEHEPPGREGAEGAPLGSVRKGGTEKLLINTTDIKGLKLGEGDGAGNAQRRGHRSKLQ